MNLNMNFLSLNFNEFYPRKSPISLFFFDNDHSFPKFVKAAFQ